MVIDIVIGFALTLYIALGSRVILIILTLQIYEHSISFNWFVSPSVSSCLTIFSVHVFRLFDLLLGILFFFVQF